MDALVNIYGLNIAGQKFLHVRRHIWIEVIWNGYLGYLVEFDVPNFNNSVYSSADEDCFIFEKFSNPDAVNFPLVGLLFRNDVLPTYIESDAAIGVAGDDVWLDVIAKDGGSIHHADNLLSFRQALLFQEKRGVD